MFDTVRDGTWMGRKENASGGVRAARGGENGHAAPLGGRVDS